MEKKNLIYLTLICLFLIMFFFKVIPVPVESIQGGENPDKFIYGGLIWTSLGEQLKLGNYVTPIAISIIFLILGILNYQSKKGE